VTITTDDSETDIRYTVDGSLPSENSPRYSDSPIRLTHSTLVRARGFKAGIAGSPAMSVGYIAVAPDVRTFNSNLPVVLIDNFGGGRPPKEPKVPAFMAIIEPREGGRTDVNDPPKVQTRIGIEIRGSSTAGREKASYSLEARDDDDEDKKITVLGMPEDADWVLYGAYNFDLALMRNELIYSLSNQIGRYAVRSRLVEVFFNQEGGSLSSVDYDGVYSFMEKISRGERRVDVEGLAGDATGEPEIAGGYILKIDRADPEGGGFSTAHQGSIQHVYPQVRNLTSLQRDWVRDYFQEFDTVLFGPEYRDPVRGYLPYVEVDSWVDHHLLNVLALNVDALRLSTYFHKTRYGKIEFGPIWDFDRSMGSTDGRDDNPRVWGSNFYDYGWWGRLFDDPDFYQRWIDRWFLFRTKEFSMANINMTIEHFAGQLSEPSVRNFNRWGLIEPSQWRNQVEVLRNWLSQRVSWIDDQFTQPPTFSSPGGRIDPGFRLTMSAPSGTIYYTLDGSDPRGSGGITRGVARAYSDAITLTDNTRVVARARLNASNWSAPTTGVFVVTPTQLVITEIMYHPADGPEGSPHEDNEFEFIEFFNRGPVPIDLTGMTVIDGVRFTFPAGAIIDGGRYAVIVANVEAFKARYPHWPALAILGEYTGSLENRGEHIEIRGALEETIVSVAYDDDWWPSTDGDGYSLILEDPLDARNPWDEKSSWRPSRVFLGTPGEANPGGAGSGGWQRPGDINQDGVLNISDAVGYLRVLFGLAGIPQLCDSTRLDQGGNLVLLDLNGDAAVDVSDAVHLLSFLFQQGPPPTMGTGCIRIEGCPHVCGL
jgi:hypothetical protein